MYQNFNIFFGQRVLATTRQSPSVELEQCLQKLKILNQDFNFQETTADQVRDEFIKEAFIKGLFVKDCWKINR